MEYVAKIDKEILLNSRFEVLKRWVNPKSRNKIKYLTQSQYDKLTELGFYPTKLLKPIKDNYQRPKKIVDISEIVIWEDEEGKHETEFKSSKEASEWISFQESLASTGEKFNLIERRFK